MNMDMKGNLRGACQQPGCDCDEFVTEGSKIRCAYCEHGPAVHQLIPGATANNAAAADFANDPDLKKVCLILRHYPQVIQVCVMSWPFPSCLVKYCHIHNEAPTSPSCYSKVLMFLLLSYSTKHVIIYNINTLTAVKTMCAVT